MMITSRIISICSLVVFFLLSSLAPQLADAAPVSGEISSEGTWKFPKLRADSNGVFYTLYWYNPDNLALDRKIRILWWDGAAWQEYTSISATDVNTQLPGKDFIVYGNQNRTNFAIDSQDRLHVIFSAGSSSLSSTHDPIHGIYDGNWSFSLVSDDSNSPNNISLYIDSSDNMHVAYTVDGVNEGRNHILKYATNQSSLWAAHEILPNPYDTNDRGNDELHDTHIVVDGAGKVTILFRREDGQSNHWDNYYQAGSTDFTNFSVPTLILDGNTANKEFQLEASLIDSNNTIHYIYNNVTDSTAHFCTSVSSICSSAPLTDVSAAVDLKIANSTLYLLTSFADQYLWKYSVNYGNLWQDVGNSFTLTGAIQDSVAIVTNPSGFMVVSESSADWKTYFTGAEIGLIINKGFPWLDLIPGLVSPNKSIELK